MLNGTETIRPLRDRVLVKELPWRNQTSSGLQLPDQAQRSDEVWRALVVAVGPGKPAPGLVRRLVEHLERIDREGAPALEGRALCREARSAMAAGFGADVKPGDVVLVSKYVHSKIGYGDEQLCCIAATDILGVVEGESNALRQALETALAKLDAAGFGVPADEDGPPLELVGS